MPEGRSIGFIVLVDAGENDVHKIREALLQLEPIELAHCPLGPTDLICYGRVPNLDGLRDLMREELPKLLETQFNPIEKTETLMVLDQYGEDLTAETHGKPNGKGAWIFTDQKISSSKLTMKLLEHYPQIKAAYNVMGSHDGVFYAEAPTLDELMSVIDEGFRSLRGVGLEGKTMKALSRTDTRLVLM